MNTLFDLSRPVVDPTLVDEKIMAIDFGKKGGFCWNIPATGELKVEEMPADKSAVYDIISEVMPSVLVGEDVHAFPGQGVVSVATFMRDAGFIDGICMALQIPTKFITPQEWVRWYQIGKSGDFPSIDAWKKHLFQHAAGLYPSVPVTQRVADAVLLWNYYLNPQRIRKVKDPTFK